MATLHFKGKSAVWNHHLSVPYQTLDPVAKMSHKGKDEEENLIIEGDNLTALKSLLPKYQGKIKCIYIDPPYNTGNEGWVYNDNVNNPIIKSWIGEVVGKEGEDLTRHDKWLCMMTPRIKLLKELLTEDGAIFVSIDDNEHCHLKLLLDEVFGYENFIGNFIVNTTPNARDYGHIGKMHEFCLFYAKNIELLSTNMLKDEDRNFNYLDDKGDFNIHPLYNSNVAFTDKNRPNLYYPFYLLKDKKDKDGFYEITLEKKKGSIEIYPPKSQKKGIQFVWRWGKEKSIKWMNKEIVGYQTGDGTYRIVQKMRTSEKIVRSLMLDKSFTSRRGTAQIEELFGDKVFSFPKPSELIKTFVSVCGNKESIVLDSFAGSGSTAQAVLDLNKEDGGNRKFILVQIPEETGKDSAAYKAGYKTVQEITQARVKKVIERDNLDTGFTYYKLGQQIDADGILSGELPSYDDFAKYVYYLATGKNYPTKSKVDAKKYFVGKDESTAVFLVYENDFDKLKSMALTLDLAKDLHKQHEGRKIVYAPACFLDEHHLDQFNITFVGIPFNLFERN